MRWLGAKVSMSGSRGVLLPVYTAVSVSIMFGSSEYSMFTDLL